MVHTSVFRHGGLVGCGGGTVVLLFSPREINHYRHSSDKHILYECVALEASIDILFYWPFVRLFCFMFLRRVRRFFSAALVM